MAYDPTKFNIDPYYDDYDQIKKFVRMLFRPGYAVQARELTQIQTILQNQINRFGDNILKDGSIVTDGQIFDNKVKFVRVTGLTGTSSLSDLDGLILTSNITGGAQAKVLFYDSVGLSSSTLDNVNTLYFDYISGGTGFTSGSVLSATIDATTITATVAGLSGITNSAIGDAILVSVNEGIRYVDGFFVQNDTQKIAVYTVAGTSGNEYRSYENPTSRVGFDVAKSFVTSTDDTSLQDPAFGSYNFAAPGADRYKIDLNIAQYPFYPSLTATTDNFSRKDFIEFIRIIDGTTVKKEVYTDYAVLEDTLARRTYDESGNYTVRPFDLSISSDGVSADKLVANLDPGKAYVFGYEFETQGVSKVALDRARSSAHERSLVTQVFNRLLGPYTVMSAGGTANSFGTTFSLLSQPPVYLSTVTGGTTFSSIGTARLRNVEDSSGSSYEVYLYDISMTGSFGFDHVKSIFLQGRTGNSQQIFQVAAGVTASLNDASYNNLLYAAPNGNTLKTVSAVDYSVFTVNTLNFNSGYTGTFAKTYNSFSLPSTIGSFPSPEVSVFASNGASLAGSYSLTGSNLVLTLSATGATTSFVVAKEKVTSLSNIRTKTLVKETITLTDTGLTTDTQGNYYLYLNKNVDVLTINGISGNNGSGVTNMFSSFYLDNGQRDNYYGWSRIVLNPNVSGATSMTGPWQVNLERFSRSGYGPFIVDSYSASVTSDTYTGYDDIPSYTTNAGQTYQLRDVVDFRPDLSSSNTMTGCFVPTHATDNNFSYTHYLPRTDKIVLTRDRSFKIIKGVPDINPLAPADDPDAMTLYTVAYNPYTFDANDLSTRYVENKRFTMQDIGRLENRLNKVEFYTSLGILEQEAKNTSILDSDNIEMPKLGILVDTFKGHNIGDVKNSNYGIAVDFDNTELRPKFRNRVYGAVAGTVSSITGSADGIYTLNYSTTPFVSQPLASTSAKINPSGVFNYLGKLTITPSSDAWYDDTHAVLVKVNVEGENDAWAASATGNGFGSQWNDWETNWNGKPIAEDSYQSQNRGLVTRETDLLTTSSVDHIQNRSGPQSIKTSNLNKIVSKNIVPFARATTLTINAEGLKPSTRVYPFFDGVDVSSYCTGTLTSDAYGKITGLSFALPASTFRTGYRLFRLTDSSTDTVSESTTSAELVFRADGTIQSREDGIVSTRPAIVRRESVKSENIVNNIFTRNRVRDGTTLIGAIDPLSQTFTVDSNLYPNGVFVKKVSLYFAAIEDTTNTPVVLQLRPTANGFPHPSKIIPFSEVVKYKESITTSTDASSATDFSFSSPVYLAPGDYALCLLSSSSKYEVFTAQIGQTVLGAADDQRINSDAYVGNLFKPQNSGEFTPSNTEDLAFVLHRCDFVTSGSISFTNQLSSTYGTAIYAHTYRLASENLVPSGTDISWSEVGLLSTPTATSILSNVNVSASSTAPGVVASKNPTATITTATATLSGTAHVSPVIDNDRLVFYLIENLIDNVAPTITHVDASDTSQSKYITKSVTLADGISGTNLHIFLNAVKQYGTSISVYVKTLPQGDISTLDNKSWVPLTVTSDATSNNPTDFRELKYSLAEDVADYISFAIKIVLSTSTDKTTVPIIKNMRAIVV